MTRIQADILEREGHHCILGYLREFEHPSVLFDEKIRISADNIEGIREFCAARNIDYVINQMQPFNYELLKPFKDAGAILIHAFYAQPQMWGVKKHEIWENTKKSRNPKTWIKTFLNIIFYSHFKRKSFIAFQIFFRKDYDYCDYYMLLTKRYFNCLKEFVPYADESKIISIGNPITYNEILKVDQLQLKKNEVLSICRFSFEKRIEEMLAIWKEVEKDTELKDWTFNLIGDGSDRKKLQRLARRLKLKRIRFLGQIKAPISYYKSASIFMMTSELEGWPMVLNECQQFGDVPIAYDSFAALYDIIDDGENGMIVNNADRISFVNKLKKLMKDNDLRLCMMKKTLTYSKAHTKEKYAEDFLKIIKPRQE